MSSFALFLRASPKEGYMPKVQILSFINSLLKLVFNLINIPPNFTKEVKGQYRFSFAGISAHATLEKCTSWYVSKLEAAGTLTAHTDAIINPTEHRL